MTTGLLLLLASQALSPVVLPTQDPFIIFFGPGIFELGPEQSGLVKNAATASRVDGSNRLEVVGNADRQGSSVFNLRLSWRRANAVRSALIASGVPAGAITVNARGENFPIVATEDGIGHAQNRNVTIMVW